MGIDPYLAGCLVFPSSDNCDKIIPAASLLESTDKITGFSEA